MFLDILELNVEQKKKLWKTVLKMCKNCLCVHKTTLEKVKKKKNYKNTTTKILKTFFLLISETSFSKQFFLNNIFLFSTLNLRMCKLRLKMRNSQNLSHESPNLRNIFLSNFTDHITKIAFPKCFFLFSTQNSSMPRNMCI